MSLALREAWLNAAATELGGLFALNSLPLPSYRVSCGFPSTGGTRSRNKQSMRVGECHAASNSADAHVEIYIHPELSDPMKVMEVLAHELCHAAVGLEAGHGPKFKAIANAIGLTGPMRSTVGSDAFKATVRPWINDLGPYPHASLTLGFKKQTTRMLKAKCPDCGYSIRLTAKWAALGLPTCNNGHAVPMIME
ncbi:MAG: transcription elongation protein SprT [Caulobacteraceae bacterium]|nr:transcription elongation protein SprT [Caulobacteraceae bacterium]